MIKKNVIGFCAVMLFIFIAGAALSYAATVKSHEYTDPKERILTHVGKKVNISLRSNMDAGYQWRLVKMPKANVLRFVSSHVISMGSRVGGTKSQEIWTFEAVGRGKAKLAFKHVRIKGKGKTAAKKEIFTVLVK